MRLVLASGNPHKLAELAALLGGLAVDLVAQGALAVDQAAEPHITFIENALAKARHAAAAAGSAAIADDSGLCVDALGGQPGVASAHYAAVATATAASPLAQRAAQDAANNSLLLHTLRGVADRSAHFISTLVAVRHAQDPQPLVAVGRWSGLIAHAAHGGNGFGYDPLVFIPACGCTVADMADARKNALSHRALAAAQMLSLLREVWRL